MTVVSHGTRGWGVIGKEGSTTTERGMYGAESMGERRRGYSEGYSSSSTLCA